jgi:serine/threonine-protein kinase
MVEGEFAPGVRVGRYEIVELLGSGAMGEVYLARDVSLNRHVAIKALNDAHLGRADLRERFAREARAVAALNHPNVVQIFDIAEHAGRPYFVMEYLKGVDVSMLLERRGRLPEPEAVAIGLAAAMGLAEAAATGVVHRDVKPANLVVTERGALKVTDFGLAKGEQIGVALTGKGVTLGTPDYMSPEQARGGNVDARSDIYALGCTLFHLLAGRPPFRHRDERVGFADVVLRHLKQPPPALVEELPEIDAELAQLVAAMMEKEPDARPGYEEIVARLQAIASRVQAIVPHASSLLDLRRTTQPTVIATPGERESADPPQSTTLDVPRLLPRWTLVLSLISLAAFVSALVLYLVLHPAPAAVGAGSSRPPATDGGARSAEPEVPEGMVLVSVAGGAQIGVAVEPVTARQVRAVAPEIVSQLRPRATTPALATGPSLLGARLVTARLGGRLPSSEEWLAILASRSVRTLPADCELVDDGATPKARCFKASRAVVRAVDRTYRNSIFRLVRPLPR